MSSCIDQNLEDCPTDNQDIRIYFSEKTIENTSVLKIANEEIKDIKLFIFDESGNYIRTEHDANPAFNSDYYMSLSLDPGVYTFVSWINMYTPYNKNEFSTLDEMRIYIEKDKEDVVKTNPHALFQAYETPINITEQKLQTVRLFLTQNTNTINIRTENFHPENDSYQMVITALNGIYKYDNSFASDTEEVHYISALQISEDSQLFGTQNILRLSHERKDPVIKVMNTVTGDAIYTAKLMNLIDNINQNGTVIDIDNIHVYDILLIFKYDPTDPDFTLKVSINGWVVNEGNTEL